MATTIECAKQKQIFKIPNGDFQIVLPEPFFFIVKSPGRKFTDQEFYAIDAANENL